MRFDNWSVGEAIVDLIEELKIMTKSWVKTLIVLAISFPLSAQISPAENPSERLQPLVRASAERIDLARQVALAKWDSGAAVEDLVREQQVIQAVAKAAPQRGLDESFVANFFRAQIEANKTVQIRAIGGLESSWTSSSPFAN